MEGVGRALGSGMAFQLRIGRGDRLRYLRGWNNRWKSSEDSFFVCLDLMLQFNFRDSSHGRRLDEGPSAKAKFKYLLYVYTCIVK